MIYSRNKYSDRQTDKHKNYCMAMKLTMAPKGKEDLCNKEKLIKIRAFFQKLLRNERIASTKLQEKVFEKKSL